MNQKNVDVAIVGYGPVSKLLATLLGQKGWKVSVHEKYPKTYPLPRAVHLDDEIARILQSIIPSSEIERNTIVANDFYEWVNADRQTLLRIDWTQYGISGWPGHLFFSQPEIEELMDTACHNNDTVSVNYGSEAVGLTEFDDHVELIVKDQDGEETTIHAQYVVGCDGANSFVRKNMEHTITDLGFVSDFLVVDVIPKVERKWSPMNLQVCDPARPTTVVSGGPGRRRWEFMALPGEIKEDLNKEEVAWRLIEPWDLTPENSILERHAVYTFKAQWVDEWRKGRLILAGDAAHLTPPFMGQGLCSGLRDSKNLAWKLDLVLSGKVDDSILDQYTKERKPHNRDVVDAALYLGKVICVPDPVEAEKRDAAFLSGDIPPFPDFPILTEGILYQPEESRSDNLAGELSFQSQVKYQGKTGLFDDIVGHQGWTIISPVANPKKALNLEQIEFMEKIGAKFIEISDNETTGSNAIIDIDGKYGQYFKEKGVEAVIVRPDYYLFGSTSSFENLSEIVENLYQKLKKFMSSAAAI